MNTGATDDPQKPAPAATDSPAAVVDLRPPIAIPDHALLRKIGGGSYGDVWLAQHQMGMYRAVKIVARASFKDQKPFERELSILSVRSTTGETSRVSGVEPSVTRNHTSTAMPTPTRPTVRLMAGGGGSRSVNNRRMSERSAAGAEAIDGDGVGAAA